MLFLIGADLDRVAFFRAVDRVGNRRDARKLRRLRTVAGDPAMQRQPSSRTQHQQRRHRVARPVQRGDNRCGKATTRQGL